MFPWIIYQDNQVYGLWYINNNIESTSICWLRIQSEKNLGYPIWVLFFVPLVLVYFFCGAMMVSVYYRLRRGLSQSFLPRVRLLVTSATTIAGLFLYWTTSMVLYATVFYIRDYIHESTLVFKFLLFVFASKGFSSLIIWINLRGDHQYFNPSTSANDRDSVAALDANVALREEVLSIATAGIRSTSCLAVTPDMESFTRRSHFHSRQPMQPNNNGSAPDDSGGNSKQPQFVLTPLIFFKFAMGFDTQNSFSMISSTLRRVNTVDEDEFLPSDQNSSNVRPSIMLLDEDNPMNPSNNIRLSQRPTIASNSLTGPHSNSGLQNSFLKKNFQGLGSGTLKRASGTNAGGVGKSQSSLAMIPESKHDADDRQERAEAWTSPLAPAPVSASSFMPDSSSTNTSSASASGGVTRQSQAKRGSDGMKMKPSIAFSESEYQARKSTCKHPSIPASHFFNSFCRF